MAQTSQASQAKPEPVVKWKTGSPRNVRRISAADWKKAGVENQTQVEWNPKNRHTVKASELSKEALEVLKADGAFVLPDED